MKPRNSPPKPSTLAGLATAAGILLAANSANSGVFTWDGGGADGNWTTAANWVDDILPVDGGTFHTYVFDGTLNTTTSADLTASAGGLNAGDLIFNSGAGAFTIQGPRAFDMLGVPAGASANTETADIINNSTATQTITAELIHRPDFNTGLVFNADAGGIVVPGIVSQGGAGDDPVIIGGANTVLFSGANTYLNDTLIGLSLLSDDFESYTVNAAPGGDWDQGGTGTVRVEEEGPGGNRYLGFGWEGGDPSAGTSRSATRTMSGIGADDSAFVTFDARVESDTGEWYFGVSDTPPTNFNGGFAGMNYQTSIGLVEDATPSDGKVDLVAGVEGGGGTTTLASLNTNQWYAIALHIDNVAGTYDVLVDGVKQNVTALAFQSTPAGDLDQFTVTGGGGARFDGQLDNLAAVAAGTLQVDGTHTNAGNYVVDSGSTLTGTGSISLSAGNSLSAGAQGVVAPGDRSGSATGTLTVTGNVVLGTGILSVRVDGTNDASDTLAVTGDLDVTGATLDLSDIISAPDDASYTLATYTGTLNGPVFTNLIDVPAGYSVSYATAGEIQLVAGGDVTPPTLINTSPPDNAGGVLGDADLVATFDEVIQAGTGNITLKRTGDDSTVEAFNVMSSTRLTFSGPTVTIDPTNNLVGGTEYYVLIDDTAVEDAATNPFAGIALTTQWSFIAEEIAPTVSTLNPADDATGVFPNSIFTIVFDEEVQVGTGNITFRLDSDNSAVETIDVTSGSVTVNGTEVTIVPTMDLPINADLYVNIPSGAFQDLASNPFAGITGTMAWSFTTADTTPIVAENFAGGGAPLNGTSADVFDAAITTAGGSATWVAGGAFLDDGTVAVAAGSSLAYLDLGTYIDDTKGTADGKFELTMTVSETAAEWISLGFSSLHAPSTTSNFVAQSGLATIIRREVGDWDLDMFPELGVDVRIEGPEPADPGPRTLTVTVDLTPAGGYDGSTNFGTATWSDSALGILDSYTYTTDFSFGSIMISESNNSGGTISALTLTQVAGPATPYDAWAASFGLTGPDADPMADTENSGAGDGLEQLLEFAFGTNPNVSDNTLLEVTSGITFTPGTPIANVAFSPLNVTYRFVRRVDHVAAGLTYTPQFTANGADFEDSADPPTVVVPDDGSGYEVVEVPFMLFLPGGMKADSALARVAVTLAP